MGTITQIELKRQDRDYQLFRARCDQLRQAGYGLRAALLLALDPKVDVDYVSQLRAAGHPEERALRLVV